MRILREPSTRRPARQASNKFDNLSNFVQNCGVCQTEFEIFPYDYYETCDKMVVFALLEIRQST